MDNSLNNSSQSFSYPSVTDDNSNNSPTLPAPASDQPVVAHPVASQSTANTQDNTNTVTDTATINTAINTATNVATKIDNQVDVSVANPQQVIAPQPVDLQNINPVQQTQTVQNTNSVKQPQPVQGLPQNLQEVQPNLQQNVSPTQVIQSDGNQVVQSQGTQIAQNQINVQDPLNSANNMSNTNVKDNNLSSNISSISDSTPVSNVSPTPDIPEEKEEKGQSALEVLANKLSTFKDSLLSEDTSETDTVTEVESVSSIAVSDTTDVKPIESKKIGTETAIPVKNTDNNKTVSQNLPVNEMKADNKEEITGEVQSDTQKLGGSLPNSYTTVAAGTKKKKQKRKKNKAKPKAIDPNPITTASNNVKSAINKESIQTSQLAKNIDLDIITAENKAKGKAKTIIAKDPAFDPASAVKPVNIIEQNNSKRTSSNVQAVPPKASMEVKTTVKNGKYPLSIHQLMDIVIERDASDLHLSVGYPATIRVDGSLLPISDIRLTKEMAAELVTEVLPDSKKELLEVNREVDLAYAHGKDARFRINAYYQQQTLAAAFRLIPSKIRTIEELNLPPIFNQLSKLRQGFVLITGPTGSGKSTTLAALVQEINNTRADHLITVEDPIEYIYPKSKAFIDQRELHDDTHSWEIAMKSALRQDPDVVLVGELRDYETISAAITLAETGHLVFATLHTNSAAQTVDRLIDVFPEHQQAQVRSQLSNALEAVVAQRLVPLDKGGRMAVTEIMITTPAIRNLIREGKTHQINNVIVTSSDIGMTSMEASLVKMVRNGLITMERAQEYAVHPEEVVRLLK